MMDNNNKKEKSYVFGRRINEEKHTQTISSRGLDPKEKFIIDFLEIIDEEELSLTRDCNIPLVNFDRISSMRDCDKGMPKTLSKDLVKTMLSLGFSKDLIKQNSRHILKGLNYLFLYKFLRSYKMDNLNINRIIEENLDVLMSEDFSFLNNEKEISYIKQIIPYTEVNKETFTFLTNYSRLKRILNTFDMSEEAKLEFIDKYLSNHSMKKEFNADAIKNAKILNTLAKIEKVDYNKFLMNSLNNIDVIYDSSYTKLLSYIAMFNYGNLDYEVLQENLGVIKEYDEELPVSLYRYISRAEDENLSSSSLSTIERIKENYNLKTLKKEYPIIVDNQNKIIEITRAYKKKINEKISEHNLNKTRKGV